MLWQPAAGIVWALLLCLYCFSSFLSLFKPGPGPGASSLQSALPSSLSNRTQDESTRLHMDIKNLLGEQKHFGKSQQGGLTFSVR